jgi:hypothetical protein
MRKLTTASIFVGAAFLLAACSDIAAPGPITGPTAHSVLSPTLGVTPVPLVSLSAADPVCPAVPPFTVSLNLSVHPQGIVNLFVTQIRLQFVDTFGVRMPQITLPMPQATRPMPQGTLPMPQAVLPMPQATRPMPQASTQMTQVTLLPAPVPTVQPGIFPVSFGVGCGTSREGMVTVMVDTRDELGRPGTAQISVDLR